jgi:hypothetical protein
MTAGLTIGTDVMVQAAVVGSAGLLLPLSVVCGVVIAIIAYLIQRKFGGDDNDAALIKALIVGFLTAIPSPLPYVLFVPAGLVGFFRRK